MPSKYALPEYLAQVVSAQVYRRWLHRKAQAHAKRDRTRGYKSASVAGYKRAIQDAVVESMGVDYYTGEQLDWTLISKYRNDAAKKHRHLYKAKFALLPTVDHPVAGKGSAGFVICAWRTNDAKNDLSGQDFIELCRRVVAFADKDKPGDC